MSRSVCLICGYVYDQKVGDPYSDTPPGTDFNALPEDWRCPECGADRIDFEQEDVPWDGGASVTTASQDEDGPGKDRGQSRTPDNNDYGFPYFCQCGYMYNPTLGDIETEIPPRTKFEDLPEDWVCPRCGCGRDSFSL